MIITNSLNALQTSSKLQIPCILIGGEYYEKDMCFVGSIAEQYAEQFNIDVAFFHQEVFPKTALSRITMLSKAISEK